MQGQLSGVDEDVCWQYKIRIQNLEEDLKIAQITKEEMEKLRARDFEFTYVEATDKEQCTEIKNFILRHEWLKSMPLRPSHRFTARYKGKLAGALVLATPNSFSNLLGQETKNLERLIARGACISWSPKNLGSRFIAWALRWMVANTSYRLFTGYADPEAFERGRIYRACNFTELEGDHGVKLLYKDPLDFRGKWQWKRNFFKCKQMKQYAKLLGIAWVSDWNNGTKILWDNIPPEVEKALKEYRDIHMRMCITKKVPPKKKFYLLLGKNSREQRQLESKLLPKYK